MPKVKQFNRGNIDDMRKAIEIALKSLNAIGVSAEIGSIRYSNTEIHTKITLNIAAEGSNNAKSAWDRNCFLFGFKPEDFKESFVSNGKIFEFVRFDPRKPKYPVIANCGGKQFKLTLNTLRNLK